MTERAAGAVPAYKLAELDSGVHHLREQADLDRRAIAQRHRDITDRLDRIDQAHTGTASLLGRVVDLTNRLDVSSIRHDKTLGDIQREQAEHRGALRLVGVLAAGIPLLIEIARHIFR